MKKRLTICIDYDENKIEANTVGYMIAAIENNVREVLGILNFDSCVDEIKDDLEPDSLTPEDPY